MMSDQVQETVDVFLQERGFSRTDAFAGPPLFIPAWQKLLGCGVVVRIENQLFGPKGFVEYELRFPDPSRQGPAENVPRIKSGRWKAADGLWWKDKWTERLAELEAVAEEASKIKCPHCGDFMQQRTVKKAGDLEGKSFFGCIRYPKCRGIRAEWKNATAEDDGKLLEGVVCPECASPLVIRYGKKPGRWQGHKFYGCSGYPDCKRIVGEEEFMGLKMMGPNAVPPEDEDNPWKDVTQP